MNEGIAGERIADFNVAVDAAMNPDRCLAQAGDVDFDRVAVPVSIASEVDFGRSDTPAALLHMLKSPSGIAIDRAVQHGNRAGPFTPSVPILDARAAETNPDLAI